MAKWWSDYGVRGLLTIMLMTVDGARQRRPGDQSTDKIIVATTLVTKAYLGSLVSVGLASVCCVATMGILGWARTTCGCVV